MNIIMKLKKSKLGCNKFYLRKLWTKLHSQDFLVIVVLMTCQPLIFWEDISNNVGI